MMVVLENATRSAVWEKLRAAHLAPSFMPHSLKPLKSHFFITPMPSVNFIGLLDQN